MRYFIFLMLIGLPSVGFSQSLKRCMNFFSGSKTLQYKISPETQLTNPYSKELFVKLYQQIENQSLFSHKEKQEIILKTEQLINFMESHPDNKRLKVLTPLLVSAIESLPALFDYTKNSVNPYLDSTSTIKVILVILTHYTWSYIHQESNHLDWPRLNKILLAIAHFKTQPNDFSLYKILRTVREKHSIEELIHCR